MEKRKLLLTYLLFINVFAFAQKPLEGAEKDVDDYIKENKIKENRQRGIYIDSNKVIHIFLDDEGNLIGLGAPTTATEQNRFQIHLLTNSPTDKFKLEVTGNYDPIMNIDKENKKTSENASKLSQRDFAVVGPYATQVTFTVKKQTDGKGDFTAISVMDVKIAKTIYASVGSGFVVSSLKNPVNIRKLQLEGSDSTLIADNPRGNATLAIMATLYPLTRNSLMLQSRSLRDRLGVVVGTTIASNDKNFKNLYLGLQYDFSMGGSFVFGADIAERQSITNIDYNDFEFGETKFTGDLSSKLYKDIGVGVFFGVQVDSRIFSKMFTP